MNEEILSEWARQISYGARQKEQRSGQWLFNSLPGPIARVVSGTLWDPFHRNYTEKEIVQWLDNHLIFDHNQIIAVFNGDTILWESPPATPTN